MIENLCKNFSWLEVKIEKGLIDIGELFSLHDEGRVLHDYLIPDIFIEGYHKTILLWLLSWLNFFPFRRNDIFSL